MSTHTYQTNGTCSREISFELNDGIISNVRFERGCSGNTHGIAKLVEGRNAREIAAMLKGTPCGEKPTSCPDQLARAIEAALQPEIKP